MREMKRLIEKFPEGFEGWQGQQPSELLTNGIENLKLDHNSMSQPVPVA